ncbi:MAG: hypothetical protein F6K11_16365 [Leptolyngbya sp. SIO3F4]|nr:hypothetical protein [Leptolyngbya sp. SIO3F4]
MNSLTNFPDVVQDSSVVLPIDLNPLSEIESPLSSGSGQNTTALLEFDTPLFASAELLTDVSVPFSGLSAIADEKSPETDGDSVTRLAANTALLQSDAVLDSQNSITEVVDLGEVLQIPGTSSTQTSLRFEWAARDAFYNNEVGVYVMELVHLALKNVSLGNTPQQSESLKAGAAISAAQVISPAIAEALMPAQKLLAATNATEVVYLTPTSLGERLGISARMVNTTLINMGLQFKNMNPSKGEPSYLPTEEGKPYSMMTVASGKSGDMTTYQHLKWSERVLELFQEHSSNL